MSRSILLTALGGLLLFWRTIFYVLTRLGGELDAPNRPPRGGAAFSSGASLVLFFLSGTPALFRVEFSRADSMVFYFLGACRRAESTGARLNPIVSKICFSSNSRGPRAGRDGRRPPGPGWRVAALRIALPRAGLRGSHQPGAIQRPPGGARPAGGPGALFQPEISPPGLSLCASHRLLRVSGNSPLLDFIGTTARLCSRRFTCLPLAPGPGDFAPVVGMVLILLLLYILPVFIVWKLAKMKLNFWPQ